MCVALFGCKNPTTEHENQPGSSSRHDGKQWLAWPGNERVHFVAAISMGMKRAFTMHAPLLITRSTSKRTIRMTMPKMRSCFHLAFAGKALTITQSSNQTPLVIQT